MVFGAHKPEIDPDGLFYLVAGYEVFNPYSDHGFTRGARGWQTPRTPVVEVEGLTCPGPVSPRAPPVHSSKYL